MARRNILVGLQLLKIPTTLVHPFLVPHITRLHLAFVPIEIDIRLGGCIVALSRVACDEGIDICQVSVDSP